MSSISLDETLVSVRGGSPLRGSVRVGGSRKASLALLAAATLATGGARLEGLSLAEQVQQQIALLSTLGVPLQQHDTTLQIEPVKWLGSDIGQWRTGSLQSRAILLFIGPMLARTGHAVVPLPGPSETGPSPIDLHLKGLAALGASSHVEAGLLHLVAPSLQGADIFLDYPSAGATINLMMAATGSKGRTTIRHAARDPEVVDVAAFLMAMGAHIRGAGADVITIEGGQQMRFAQHRVMGDRHEGALFLAATLACQGEIALHGVEPIHLQALLAKLQEMGAKISVSEAMINVSASTELRSTLIRALPYPGFPSEFYLLLAPILAKASGTSIISDATTSANRMLCLEEMRRLGLKAIVEPGVAVLHGGRNLTGASVCAYGPTSAPALLVGLLAAEGEGLLEGGQHLAMHYANAVEQLAGLGADVSQVRVDVSR